MLVLGACNDNDSGDGSGGQATSVPGLRPQCVFVEGSQGPEGQVALKVEKVVTGLEVPWAIGFLPGGDALVTERPGRVRRISGGVLQEAPVLTLTVGEQGEGGLMGLAVDPRFSENRAFYVYYTAVTPEGSTVNRLARYRLSGDGQSAALERTLIEGIPAGTFHNGGRLKFGPDGALYVGTGDAREPELAQDSESLAGKLLRISPDGGNPEVFLSGIRNTQGFDWWNDATLVVSDHGPTGELGLRGRDEVTVAVRGDNLGWPRITGCQEASGLKTPAIAWQRALPPGGLLIYRGDSVAAFRNSTLIAVLGATHLQRIAPNGDRERYLIDQYGRLRDIVQAPDGSIWVTTSNCDGRGDCGSEKDLILRLTGA